MASPRLLLLLLLMLMSSSFVLSSPSTRLSSDQRDEHALQKRGKIATAGEYILNIQEVLDPVIDLIPVAGPWLNYLIKVTGKGLKATETNQIIAQINTNSDKLNVKLDKQHVDITWSIWAAVYGNFESQINVAWNELQRLLKDLADKKTDDNYKENRIKAFQNDYAFRALYATQQLYDLLIDKEVSFNNELGELLIEKVNCHENIIRQFRLLINELFYKGNTVSYYYYKHRGDDNVDQLAKMGYKAALLMYRIHKHCIEEVDKYIKKDVKELMAKSGTEDRAQLAKEVREHLEKAFDRYDFMTVAFITTNSDHKWKIFKFLDRHTLSGFIRASVGEVTVAVAKQLKGPNTKGPEVLKAIEGCVEKSTDCHKVGDKLKNCKKEVDGTKLSEMLTAVHAYIHKGHDCANSKDDEQASDEDYIDSDNPSTTPYVYTGKCNRVKVSHGGHYQVLIKNDEEIMTKNPCDNLKCGGKGKGKCDRLGETKIAWCECEEGYYGTNCEKSVEEYQKALLDTTLPKL